MAPLAVRRTGAGMLLATGIVHLALVPSYLADVPYLGVLFLLAGLAALAVARELWRTGEREQWLSGAALCLGLLVGFIVSRTVGLPAFSTDSWTPSGLFSLTAEGGFLLTAIVSLREPGLRPTSAMSAVGRSTRPVLPRGAPLRRS